MAREQGIQALGIVAGNAIELDERGRRQVGPAPGLTGVPPCLEFRFADGERQQAIAHGLGSTISLIDQLGGAPPVERSVLFERDIDHDVGGGECPLR